MIEPTLDLPTRDFLNKNFRKPDLQKRCRELGLTNVWTSSKSQLIEMIIEKSRPLSNNTVNNGTHTPPSPRYSPPTPREVTQTLPSDTTQQVNLDQGRATSGPGARPGLRRPSVRPATLFDSNFAIWPAKTQPKK